MTIAAEDACVRFRVCAALAAASGLLLYVSFPPVDLWQVSFVALVPLLAVLPSAPSITRAALCGGTAGIVFLIPALVWLASVTAAGWLLLAIYLSLYFCLFGALVRACALRWPGKHIWMTPVIWVGLELVRATVFTGFPWFLYGYTQYRFIPLLQFASVAGAYGIGFLLVFFNAAVAEFLRAAADRRSLRRPAAVLALAACAPAAAVCFGFHALAGLPLAEGPVFGVVQHNMPPRLAPADVLEIYRRWEKGEELSRHDRERIMQYHEEEERYAIDQIDRAASLSRELAESEPALIAWPETVVGAPLNPGAAGMLGARQSRQRRHALETLRALTGELDCYFLIGSTFLAENDSGGGSANSAYLFSPEGEIIGRYDKIFLVPFGEYTPGKNLLPAPVAELLASFAIAQSEAGEVPVVFSRPARFAASICYDNVFSSLMRRFRRDGADVIVNISNEGWYHIRGELEQHLAIAVFRAVETRTSIVRATNTGISCFIDPAGRIYGMVTGEKEGVRTAMNVKGSLAAPVLLTDHVPIYSRTGDWFAVLCAALTAVYAVCAIARCRRRPNVPENK